MGLASGVSLFLNEYGNYAIHTNPGSVPGGVLAAWLSSFVWFPTVGLVPLLFLLVPDGSLPSPGWRPVAWVAVADMAVAMAAVAVTPGPVGGDLLPGTPDNPVGIGPAGQVLELVWGVSLFLVPVLAVVALVGLALRFRRARGVERQQLKWFAYGAFLLVVGLAALFVPIRSEAVAKAVLAVGVGCFTAGVAVAVLRYGLYEIDVIINRTLVYGLITALLGTFYAGAVLVLGQLFGGIGAQPPSWTVAAATLAVAALFQPARRRIQAAVDRRFNRRKYNAARTVEVFAVRLRNQVDLDTLSAELLGVVDQTVQPTQSSLWLRPPAPARPPGQGHRG